MQVAAPEIYQPDLSKIPRTVVGQKSISQAAAGENVTGAGGLQGGQSSSDRRAGMFTDAGKKGRVGVEVARFFEPADVVGGMRS